LQCVAAWKGGSEPRDVSNIFGYGTYSRKTGVHQYEKVQKNASLWVQTRDETNIVSNTYYSNVFSSRYKHLPNNCTASATHYSY